jgi:hypothetical protein
MFSEIEAINIDRLGGRSAELLLNPAREADEDRPL